MDCWSLKSAIAGNLYCILDRYYTYNERYFKTSFFIKIIIPTTLVFLTGYYFTPAPLAELKAIPVFIMHMFTGILRHSVLLPILMFSCIFVALIFRPLSHNHLLPTGRFDHFRRTILKPVSVMIWLALIVLLTMALKDIMPDFKLGKWYFAYQPHGFSIILWLLIIIPIIDTFMYYFEKPCNAFTMILLLAIIFALSFYIFITVNPTHKYTSMALAILLANGFFFDRLARHWFRKDITMFI